MEVKQIRALSPDTRNCNRELLNEAEGKNGYYAITALHRNMDPALTYLWVKNNTTGAKEMITTTPEHPFYLTRNVDGSAWPAPVGHEDLSARWVGAGHLKDGDQLQLASRLQGSVVNVKTVQETREMFNLTVDTAHTFYVGANGWLVHNRDCSNSLIQFERLQADYGCDSTLRDWESTMSQSLKRQVIRLGGASRS